MQGDAVGALALLDQLPEGAKTGYQPALVLRAHCLCDLGKPGAGRAAEDAVGATNDPRVRAYLQQAFGIGRGK
jgi:RNA polymerase sigma-70 factor, ECF subfamily